MAAIYNTLTLEAQQEVCDFIMFLAQKYEKEKSYPPKEEVSLEKLESFASSSTSSCPKGMDPQEYISRMREDRVF